MTSVIFKYKYEYPNFLYEKEKLTAVIFLF